MSTKLITGTSKILLRLLKAVLISLFLVISTTYGWKIISFNDSSSSSIATAPDPSQQLEKTVRFLSEDIGIRNYSAYTNLNKTADFIEATFRGLGYHPEEWSYEINNQPFRNIVAKTKESENGEYIIIGAHYDSCFNPGADDNASGIAGVIELARMLKNADLKTPIMFVAFVNEEPPFFMTDKMGSLVFARQLKNKSIKIKAAVVLEMIGYYSDQWFSQKYLPLLGPFFPNKGNFIALIGNFDSKKIVDSIHNDFRKYKYFPMESMLSPETIPGINFSDHWSFWREDYPAVMITDTAYLRNKNYHQMSDRASTLDYEKMSRVIAGLKESVVHLSNQEGL